MTTLIFVHGMNGTAKNWTSVPSKLAPRVTTSFAADLPGHHIPIEFSDILGGGTYSSGVGMADYIAAITDLFPAGSGRDVVLVGHSMGGAVISQVAEQNPGRIAKLIYVAAMLPDDGQSPADILTWIMSSGLFDQRAFLGDFLPHFEQLEVVRQPAEPLAAKFSRSPEFEAIPRAYIRCTQDDVIPVQAQNKMLEVYPDTDIVTLERSHFPQFQNSEELAVIIGNLLPS